MDEREWLESTSPEPMLEYLRARTSQRKLRLFACACARRIRPLDLAGLKDAIETAEKFADGEGAAGEFRRILRSHPAWNTLRMPALRLALSAAKHTAPAAAELRRWCIPSAVPPWSPAYFAASATEQRIQVSLLRDIFGNPFQTVTLKYPCRATPVLALAQAAYDNRELPAGLLESDRLAVLADALEEAGCTDAGILGHLRGPGPHVRGCWVLDALLEKS